MVHVLFATWVTPLNFTSATYQMEEIPTLATFSRISREAQMRKKKM